jgi:single-strand DNA-binding protein
MSAQVTVIGNLTKDPELRFTKGGDAVAVFSVAVNERIKDGNDWKDGDPSFYEVKAWRRLGEDAAETLTKGTRVIVSGKLKIEKYETKDGSQRQTTVITADEVGQSVRRKGGGTQPSPQPQPEDVPF